MANSIKQVTVKGSKFNLGSIESAAIAGVEQGTNDFTAANTFQQPPVCSFSNAVEVDASTLTLAYATHAGRPTIQLQECVFTLPGIGVLGQTFWVINGAADGTLMTITINASDKFLWDVAGAAGTNNKDVYNTAATAKKGDYIKLAFGDGDGWIISEMGGIWIDE